MASREAVLPDCRPVEVEREVVGHAQVVARIDGDHAEENALPLVKEHENGGRMRAGYGRFAGNRYSTGVSFTSDGPDDWTHLPDRKSRCIPWGWVFRTLKGRINHSP